MPKCPDPVSILFPEHPELSFILLNTLYELIVGVSCKFEFLDVFMQRGTCFLNLQPETNLNICLDSDIHLLLMECSIKGDTEYERAQMVGSWNEH
jgi:hypothetical protein